MGRSIRNPRVRSSGVHNPARKKLLWIAACRRFFRRREGRREDRRKWALKERRFGSSFNAVGFRRTSVSFEDAIDRAKQIYVPLGAKFVDRPARFKMPNGGRVSFSYLRLMALRQAIEETLGEMAALLDGPEEKRENSPQLKGQKMGVLIPVRAPVRSNQ